MDQGFVQVQQQDGLFFSPAHLDLVGDVSQSMLTQHLARLDQIFCNQLISQPFDELEIVGIQFLRLNEGCHVGFAHTQRAAALPFQTLLAECVDWFLDLRSSCGFVQRGLVWRGQACIGSYRLNRFGSVHSLSRRTVYCVCNID